MKKLIDFDYFWLNSNIFNKIRPFSMKFNFCDQNRTFWLNSDSFQSISLQQFDKIPRIRKKMLIKRQLESDFKLNSGLSWFNRLSLNVSNSLKFLRHNHPNLALPFVFFVFTDNWVSTWELLLFLSTVKTPEKI